MDAEKPWLKLVAIGHVDHGKSTLIGRLLVDTGSVAKDRLAEAEKASRELNQPFELAYILDHFREERENRMTMDTTQAFLESHKRNYVFIDAPGHFELVRNMITGASQADAALMVVDAVEGIKEQTKRHATILQLLGIRKVIVALNKMDLLDYSEAAAIRLKSEIENLLYSLDITASQVVPLSAWSGENVVRKSGRMPWYNGPTLLEAMDKLPSPASHHEPLRFSIQDEYMLDGRRISVGRVESGMVRAGDKVIVLPSFNQATVKSIEVFGKDKTCAEKGECVGVVLDGSVPLQRGEVLCHADGSKPMVSSDITLVSFWISPEPLKSGDRLALSILTQEAEAAVREITWRMDSETLESDSSASSVQEASIFQAMLRADREMVFEPPEKVSGLGHVVLLRGGSVCGVGKVTPPPPPQPRS